MISSRFFHDGIPIYLARHYWWAYLWCPAIWFFDHQPIINAILFGQYRKLMSATLERIDNVKTPVLQLTCVYGHLTPNLTEKLAGNPLFITDVAQAQLELARKKQSDPTRLIVARMNVERLAYRSNAFGTVIIFFLLHEMPPDARRNTLQEVMRVVKPGGTVLLTEYGYLPKRHFLYRFPLSRWLITTLEPFLARFWLEDIDVNLNEYASQFDKRIERISSVSIFAGFYRVNEYRILAAHEKPDTP